MAGVQCLTGRLAASLASTHHVPVPLIHPHVVTTKNVPDVAKYSGDGEEKPNNPWVKITTWFLLSLLCILFLWDAEETRASLLQLSFTLLSA